MTKRWLTRTRRGRGLRSTPNCITFGAVLGSFVLGCLNWISNLAAYAITTHVVFMDNIATPIEARPGAATNAVAAYNQMGDWANTMLASHLLDSHRLIELISRKHLGPCKLLPYCLEDIGNLSRYATAEAYTSCITIWHVWWVFLCKFLSATISYLNPRWVG